MQNLKILLSKIVLETGLWNPPQPLRLRRTKGGRGDFWNCPWSKKNLSFGCGSAALCSSVSKKQFPITTATFNEFHRNSCPAIRGPGGRAACAAKIGGNPYSPWPKTWFPQWESGGRKGKSFPKRAEAPAFAKKRLLPYFGKQDALSPGPGKSFQNHKRLWKS